MTAGDDRITARLEEIERLAHGGAAALALRQLEALSLAPGMTAERIEQTRQKIGLALSRTRQRIDKPADRWSLDAKGALGAAPVPFRRLPQTQEKLPTQFPFGLALPRHRVLASLSPSPPVEAERVLPADAVTDLGRIAIILATDRPGADVPALCAMLDRQSLQGAPAVVVFAPGAEQAISDRLQFHPISICDPEAAPLLSNLAARSDHLLFLEGGTALDPTALERMARLAATSDRVVQPLVGTPPGGAFRPFALEEIARKYPVGLPFRGLRGLNMMVPSRLWAEVGGLSARFRSRSVAAAELGYRLFVAGAWFVPQQVPRLGSAAGTAVIRSEADLYRSLCPNRADRPSGHGFEVPKVSIYIPAYNCGRFVAEAVQSVLDQDYRDLEVCIHDDGSTDDTLNVLQTAFGGDPRVRWQSGPNGGIGQASNLAIGMSRSLYIGQLDADDRLLPGAISRLVERLEADPGLACVYSSCERIDTEGQVLRPEYEWPTFSHEKLLLTSIVHHFRMFRRQAFARTDGFRTDIRNAVDYDLFLKLAEVGRIEHLSDVLYQRRWHDTNTSRQHEAEQSLNTHVVQRAALGRMGLDSFWELHVPDASQPRRITYRRKPDCPVVFFWPDYTASNPYQRLLYEPFRAKGADICAASPDSALACVRKGTVDPKALSFHLHWLHFLFTPDMEAEAARLAAHRLLEIMAELKKAGVRLIWTVHNLVSHESRFPQLELALARRLATLVDLVHLHDPAGAAEFMGQVPVPADKVCIARHGHYLGTYPDHVSRKAARDLLGLADSDEVILFCGAVRPYKGVDDLIAAFRILERQRPGARLMIAGAGTPDPETGPLSQPVGTTRIRRFADFIEPGELQVFFRAADVVALPYRRVLTSGSALLALGFGCPVVLPAGTAPATLLDGRPFVQTYSADAGPKALGDALAAVLSRGPADRERLGHTARAYARTQTWPDPSQLVLLQPAIPTAR